MDHKQLYLILHLRINSFSALRLSRQSLLTIQAIAIHSVIKTSFDRPSGSILIGIRYSSSPAKVSVHHLCYVPTLSIVCLLHDYNL